MKIILNREFCKKNCVLVHPSHLYLNPITMALKPISHRNCLIGFKATVSKCHFCMGIIFSWKSLKIASHFGKDVKGRMDSANFAHLSIRPIEIRHLYIWPNAKIPHFRPFFLRPFEVPPSFWQLHILTSRMW
jgi:hypothetical protein